MTIPFSMEQHLDALVAFLRAQAFQDAVTAEDLSHSDGLLVGTILSGNVIPGGKWPIETLAPGQPAIEVAFPDQLLDNFGLGNTDADEALTVAIRAWQQHYGDPASATEEMYRLQLRLGNVILKEVLPAANNAFGNGNVVTQVRSSYRVDPATDTREAWTSSLVMILMLDGDAVFG